MVVCLSHHMPTLAATEATEDAISLAAGFTDLGRGKCKLEAGGDPEYSWFGSGDVSQICAANDKSVGYSAILAGGGLIWLSGPLQGGGSQWVGCHCMVKESMRTSSVTPAESQFSVVAPVATTGGGKEDGGTFPNIDLVARGYNLYNTDPMPEVKADVAKDPKSNVMDPGFRKPVFDIQCTQGRTTC